MVSYDLIKRKDYPSLIKALETYPYWHCLGSTWIIKSNGPSKTIYDNLKGHIDADDKLIVVKLVREATWTPSFSESCQKWLQDNL